MQIVMKDYDLKHFQEKDIYSWEEIVSIIEDMENDIIRLKEEKNDLESDIEYNYKPIPKHEQYDIYDNMFI